MASSWGGSWGASWATSWTRTTIAPSNTGTGGGGVRYTSGVPTPLSRIKGRKRDKEEDRRERSLEKLEAAIRAALADDPVPVVIPPVNIDAAKESAEAYQAAKRDLEATLALLREYEARKAQADDDDDVEILLMMH